MYHLRDDIFKYLCKLYKGKPQEFINVEKVSGAHMFNSTIQQEEEI